MNAVKLLNTINEQYQASLDGSLFDAEDNMKFSASIPVVDKVAYAEAIEYVVEKETVDTIEKEVEDLKESVSKRLEIIESSPKTLPQFIKGYDKQRFKEIDKDNFLFITSESAGSMAVYQSINRCETWRRVGGFFGLPTTDSKYSKNGIKSMDFTTDEVELEDGTKIPAVRAYWIDNNYRVKTSVINPLNGIYLDEEIVVDTTTAKFTNIGDLTSVQNVKKDKLVIYSETDGSKYNTFAMVKGGDKSIWIGVPFLSNNGNDERVSDVIIVDNIFYVAVTNNANRIYIVKIWQNEQGDFEKEIIIRDDTKYTNARLYFVNEKIWVVSYENNILEIDPKGDFIFKETNFKIQSSLTKYFTIFSDGKYLKLDTREIWKGVDFQYRIPEFQSISNYPALKNEIKTLMPIVKQGEKDTSEVGLVDFDFISKNPVIKGI
jgi:hypothetical protein